MEQKQQLAGFINFILIILGISKWNVIFHNHFFKGEFVFTPKKAIYIFFQQSMANPRYLDTSLTFRQHSKLFFFFKQKKGQINHWAVFKLLKDDLIELATGMEIFNFSDFIFKLIMMVTFESLINPHFGICRISI